MKKSELDLSKAHIDSYGNTTDNKAWSGEKLAYTKAGWATVTHDGTIVEVLDAFSGEQVKADFNDRDETFPSTQIDESALINYREIGSAGVDDDSEIFDDAYAAVLAMTPTATYTVTAVTITSGGLGYTTGALTGLVVSAPDATPAAISDYALTAGDLTTGALNPTVLEPKLTALITDGGSGYTGSIAITLGTDGSGTAATASATLTSGVVTAVDITANGSGFADGDSLTMTIAAPTTTQAVLGNITAVAGAITAVAVATPGAGYVSAPTVTVPHP